MRAMNWHWDSRDRYRRIVGWVTDSDGVEVNPVMVQTGMAWWPRFSRTIPKENGTSGHDMVLFGVIDPIEEMDEAIQTHPSALGMYSPTPGGDPL